MNKILKNKKVMIPIIVVIVGLILLLWGYYLLFSDDTEEENKVKKEDTFIAYVKINPLVKLTLKAEYYECTSDSKVEICGEYSTTIESAEFLNDDAEELYKNTDFEGKSLAEGISLLIKLAYDKEIDFDSVSITTNWSYKLDSLKEDIVNNLKSEVDVDITFNYKNEIDEQEIINNDTVKKYEVTFDSDGGSSIASQEVKENETISKPTDPTKDGYTFAGWTLDGSDFDFTMKVSNDLTLKAKWSKNETTNTEQSDSGNNETANSATKETNIDTKDEEQSETSNTTILGENEYYAVKDGLVHKYTFTFDDEATCERDGDGVAYDTVYPVRPYIVYGCDEIKDANGNIKWGLYFMASTDASSVFYY